MKQGITGRGALATPQRGEPALIDRRVAEDSRYARNGMLRLRRETNDPDDRGNDAMAVRKKPTRQGEDPNPKDGGARDRRA